MLTKTKNSYKTAKSRHFTAFDENLCFRDFGGAVIFYCP